MGRAWKFANNVNTDEIIPARYNITIDERELAQKVFCEVRPDFARRVQKGDIIVAGENFGCGSSREHAPIAIKGSGASCVIAESFARIFFRNAINIGLPIIECKGIAQAVSDGDDLEVDFKTGRITNRTKKTTLQAAPLPAFVLQIVEAGGIITFLRNHSIEALQG